MNRPKIRLADLAKLAGVSVATASRALSGHPAISEQTRQVIWKLAREQGYPLKRTMPVGPGAAEATIAIIVPRPQGREGRLSDPFLLSLLAGVGDAARDRGCDVLLSHFSPSRLEELQQAMTTSSAAGFIFMGQSSLHDAFNQLAKAETRFVVWGAEFRDQAYCSVGSDNPKGGLRATQHLIRLGRRRILFLGEIEAPEAAQRYDGYREALMRADLPITDDLLQPAHFEVESAEAAIDSLLRRGARFDGVVAASDLIALGAIRALHRAGVSVPEDVAVVGYDNVALARYSRPALTTIAQDTGRAGRLLVSKLLDAKGALAASERVPTDLIVRESCGA